MVRAWRFFWRNRILRAFTWGIICLGVLLNIYHQDYPVPYATADALQLYLERHFPQAASSPAPTISNLETIGHSGEFYVVFQLRTYTDQVPEPDYLAVALFSEKGGRCRLEWVRHSYSSWFCRWFEEGDPKYVREGPLLFLFGLSPDERVNQIVTRVGDEYVLYGSEVTPGHYFWHTMLPVGVIKELQFEFRDADGQDITAEVFADNHFLQTHDGFEVSGKPKYPADDYYLVLGIGVWFILCTLLPGVKVFRRTRARVE